MPAYIDCVLRNINSDFLTFIILFVRKKRQFLRSFYLNVQNN